MPPRPQESNNSCMPCHPRWAARARTISRTASRARKDGCRGEETSQRSGSGRPSDTSPRAGAPYTIIHPGGLELMRTVRSGSWSSAGQRRDYEGPCYQARAFLIPPLELDAARVCKAALGSASATRCRSRSRHRRRSATVRRIGATGGKRSSAPSPGNARPTSPRRRTRRCVLQQTMVANGGARHPAFQTADTRSPARRWTAPVSDDLVQVLRERGSDRPNAVARSAGDTARRRVTEGARRHTPAIGGSTSFRQCGLSHRTRHAVDRLRD